MGLGRMISGWLSALLVVTMWTATPASAEDGGLPGCPPIRLVDLGPPLNEVATTDPVTDTEAPSADNPGEAPGGDDTSATEPSATPGDTAAPEPTEPEPTEPEPTEPEPTEPEPGCIPFVYSMQFPLLTPVWAGSPFGAIRDGGDRWHAGIDLAAPKLTPVVAVADATVASLKRDPGNVWIVLRHRDGWSSAYVHLNNDSYATDDGLGMGIRPDLEVGDPVVAGTVIGWVGDSGNAEEAAPHLHFELRDPTGTPIDPATSLSAAAGRLASAEAFVGTMADDDASRHPDLFDRAIALGVPAWCDEAGLLGCPDEPATRADLVSWVEALMPDRVGLLRQAISDGAEKELFLMPFALAPVLGCRSPLFCDQPVLGSDLGILLGSSIPVRADACHVGDLNTALTRQQLLRHLFRELGHLREYPCDLIS